MEHLHEFKKGNLVNYHLQSGDTSRKLARIEEIENAEPGDRIIDLTLIGSKKSLKFIESERDALVSACRLTSEMIKQLGFRPIDEERIWWDGLLEMIPPENLWTTKDGIDHLPDNGLKLKQKGINTFLGENGRDFEFHNLHELQNIYNGLKLPLNVENLK